MAQSVFSTACKLRLVFTFLTCRNHFMANRWGNNGNSDRLFSWVQKLLQMVTAALQLKDTCWFGRTAMTNLDSILKSRDITLSTKVYLVKVMVFPVVMQGCDSWTIKKAECWRIDAFEMWCWGRFFRVPWTARRSNWSILKEISPENSLERLMLKLKLQYFGHLMQRTDSLEKNLVRYNKINMKFTVLYSSDLKYLICVDCQDHYLLDVHPGHTKRQ